MEMQTWRMDLWTQQGKERVGPTESSTDTYTLSSVKHITSGKPLCNTGSPAHIHKTDPPCCMAETDTTL